MIDLKAEWLGTTRYKNSLIMQDRRMQLLESGKGPPTVLGCEHDSVVTLGKRCEEAAELKTPKDVLKKKGVSLVKINRGGEATLHSPGQLVIYPIINLKAVNLGVKEYVNLLMAVTRKVLANKGISTAFVTKNPGLYSDNGKICFFGIRVSRGISSHGLSINVSNDLAMFQHIRPCGKDEESFDSFKNRGLDADCQALFNEWYKEFEIVYNDLNPQEPLKNEKKPCFPLTEPLENTKK